MSVRLKAHGGLGRRARRLTLAPQVASALRPCNPPIILGDDLPSEQNCKEAWEALSSFVVEVNAVPLQSKFWS